MVTGIRRPRYVVAHSPPSSTEVKNEWIYASTAPVCPHGMDRDNFLLSTEDKQSPCPVLILLFRSYMACNTYCIAQPCHKIHISRDLQIEWGFRTSREVTLCCWVGGTGHFEGTYFKCLAVYGEQHNP